MIDKLEAEDGDASLKPWEEVGARQLFSKYGREIYEVIFKMPDGQKKDFIIKKEGPAASILAFTTDDKVVLARQFRPGPKEILDELPGGYIDPEDKSPKHAIRRELLEETGYQGDIEFVGIIYDDAYSTMKRYCFVARNCKLVQSPKTENGVGIQQKTISLHDFRNLLRSGKMTDVEAGYLCLDYCNLLGRSSVE